MSDKSGVASQVLPLPTGGGAVRAIGETFTADPFTGTGTATVPIDLPAGRHGFQPVLELRYSTGHGNGPFGLGWQLSVPHVTRLTARGVPRYRDGDTFQLSGVDELVPVDGVTRYRPRTEGVFARIERMGGDGWRVSDRSGLVHRFGRTPTADATVADPRRPGDVFRWDLAETTDPFGNRIEYRYARDRGTDGPHEWDQLYPESVRYVEDDAGAYLVSVTFHYAPRPDPFSDRRAGFEVRTRRRCTRIEVRTHPDGDDVPVRTYELVYLDEREVDAALLPANGVSLLSQIRVVGHDGARTQSMPPLEFGYRPFAPLDVRPRPVDGSGAGLPPNSLAHPDFELVDLFGNGLPDIVRLDGVAEYWRNLGGGRFDRPQAMPEVPAGVRLRDPGTRFADLNGNGRADLLVLEQGGYYPATFAGRWSRDGFVRYRTAPPVSLADAQLRLLDLDGDGVVDALRTGSAFELFHNDPVNGWSAAQTVPRGAPADFPDVSFADPRVKLADMTGDGLQDIVLVEADRIRYWPYLGHGRWGRRVDMGAGPVFGDPARPATFDPRRVLLGDVDGDGVDDVVFLGDTSVTVWVNRSGDGWGPPIVIRATPPVAAPDAVRLVDLLGTGTAGILWTDEASRGTYRFADLTGGAKPYLLDTMDNHCGARTRIRYATSAANTRATTQRTPLPFPVQVVASVQVEDEVSGGTLTTGYQYHHGYWDGAEREFRGFGRVDQIDTRAGDTRAALLTRTWFHLGPIGDESGPRTEADFSDEYWAPDPSTLERSTFPDGLPPRHRADALRALRGSVLRTELYGVDGSDSQDRPFTVTEAQFGVREEEPPRPGTADRRRVFFPHPDARRVTEWERGTDPMHRFEFVDGYDRFGLPGRTLSVAVPRGRDPHAAGPPGGEPHLAVLSVTAYAQRDDDRYLVDRVARETAYEVTNDGSATVAGLLDTVRRGTARLLVAGDTVTHFDGEAFVGLPAGQVGDFGVPVRSATLVLTDAVAAAAYEALPPYLTSSPLWTDEYPAAFRADLPSSAGYAHGAGGYYADTQRLRYDFQTGGPARGLPTGSRDAMGRESTVTHDRFGLLPAALTDPSGLTTTAAYDYRVLRPRLVTDPNGNRRAFAYTPLGLLERIAVLGKESDPTGDSLRAPTTRLTYDFDHRPVSVRTVRRVHHARDATVETVEYSDGFGRLVQTRTVAEDVLFGDATFGRDVLPAEQGDPATGRDVVATAAPGTAVVVSGQQVYDTKGRIVERYEPFRDTGLAYAPPIDGHRLTLRYDARGRLSESVYPDGSVRRVVVGVPTDLADPDAVTPTPWEAYTYDRNDNAGRTHGAAAAAYEHHWDTPASVVLDALGRAVERVERHRDARPRPDAPLPPPRTVRTRYRYDIRGNVVRVVDAVGRTAFRYTYDLRDAVARVDSIDAGVTVTVRDAAGDEIERRDGKGALTLQTHDAMGRLRCRWARDGDGSAVTLRERLVYGDAADPAHRTANRLGGLYRHFDEAGLFTVDRYDHEGRVVARHRRVLRDGVGVVDWDTPEETLLADEVYETEEEYDALGRATLVRLPRDVTGRRREIRPTYNRAGAVERLDLDDEAIVAHAAYNAGGQCTLVAFGCGLVTRYAVDPRTSRLVRLRTEPVATPGPGVYRSTGPALRDTTFAYDLAGNLTRTVDRRPGCGVRGNPDAGTVADPELRALLVAGDALIRRFAYDPRYRLVSATGRECRGAPALPWLDPPRCGAGTVPNDANAAEVTATYRETYGYDDVDNLRTLRHVGDAGTRVRRYVLVPGGNRLATATFGATTLAYTVDGCGNLTGETDSRRFGWDHADRLTTFEDRASATASVDARYRYDAAGQRVQKLVRRAGGIEVTTYIDGLFEHHRWQAAGTTGANNHVHLMAGSRRVAVVRAGPAHPDDAGPAVQYHLGDHLGSSTAVVDGSGALVNREEYLPFGETSVGSFARKRFRFAGRERDEESGLNHHGARRYAPWLGRWIGCDPAGPVDGPNLFTYVRDNPLSLADPGGREPEPRQLWLFEAKAFWQEVTATAKGRGFGQKLRTIFQNMARLWGHSGAVDASHEPGKPFHSLRAGDKARVYPEPSDANRRRGREEAADKARRAAAGEFTRTGGADPNAVPGASHNRGMTLNPVYQDPALAKRIPPAAPPANPPSPSPAAPAAGSPAPLQLKLPFVTLPEPAATAPKPAAPAPAAPAPPARPGPAAEPTARPASGGRVGSIGGQALNAVTVLPMAGKLAHGILEKAGWADEGLSGAARHGPGALVLEVIYEAGEGMRLLEAEVEKRLTSDDYTLWPPNTQRWHDWFD